jgi:hypothetical protein
MTATACAWNSGQRQGSRNGPRVAAEPEGSRDGSPVRASGPVTGSRSAAETMVVAPGMTVASGGARGGARARAVEAALQHPSR